MSTEESQQFWFNTRTKAVEQGRQSHYSDLMGPYASRAEAEQALGTAAARNDAWDDQDDRWKQG